MLKDGDLVKGTDRDKSFFVLEVLLFRITRHVAAWQRQAVTGACVIFEGVCYYLMGGFWGWLFWGSLDGVDVVT